MDRKALGKRIRTERLRLNLTQEQLAERIGVSSAYAGFIERGEKLILIANTLHVSLDYLLTDSAECPDDGNLSLLKNLWRQATPEKQALILDITKSILLHSE